MEGVDKMSEMRNFLAFFLVGLLLSGCNSQMQDYVEGEAKNPNDPQPTNESNASSKAIKISPGAGQFSGSQLSGHAAFTPTGLTIQGSQIQGKVTFSQNRQN